MAAYKYYAAENARHPEALNTTLTRSQMVDLSNKLAIHFGAQPVPVFFSDYMSAEGTHSAPPLPTKIKHKFDRLSRKLVAVEVPVRTRKFQKPNWSWYSSGGGFLSYGTNMLNLLTVAHEVAHYLVRRNFYASVQAGTRKSKYVSHGVEHREQVDRCVAVLKAMKPRVETFVEVVSPLGQFPVVIQETKVEVVTSVTPVDPVVAFFDSLPPLLTCPCCSAILPKMNFGVRVMKRDANNVPTVIRRQSYCRACR